MNRLSRIGISAALAMATTLAVSQAPPGPGGPGGPGAPNPEAQARTAVETRQAVFKLIGNQNGPIGGMARPNAPAPDLAVVARNAERIQMLAGMIPELFTANTTAVTSVRTRALPAIWTGSADFKAKAEALSKAAGTLADAAKKGDLNAARAASTEVGRACSACHDAYRGPAN